jgi:hypothetical protein
MSRRIIAGVAAAGIAILASCSQDKSPNAFLPTEASLARTPALPTCSFSTASTDAKAYFTNTSGQTKDSVFTLLDAMQKAYTAGGLTGATSPGFAVLRRLGGAVGTAAVKGTPALGSSFANDVLLCMSVAGYVNPLNSSPNPVDFTKALDVGGLFAVRTSATTDNSAVVARSGRFGAEPTGLTWPVAGPTLFHGFPLPTDPFFAKDKRVGTAFDLKTLPSGPFLTQIRVGVCDLSTPGRILHVHAGDPAVVLPTNDPHFCPLTFTGSAIPSSMFDVAAHQLASWLSPKPAYAASRMMLAFKGGGTVGGLSEIGPISPEDTIIINRVPRASVSDTTLSLDGRPDSSQFNPVVSVRVLTKAGKNPLAGVTINLIVIGNKGSFTANGGTATSDATGLATFPNFYITKAGGYTISAQADTSEHLPNSFTATSNLFNIDGH